MGCDIHFYVERYSSDTDYLGPRDTQSIRDEKIGYIVDDIDVKEKWIPCDELIFNPEGDVLFPDQGYWDVEWKDRFYTGRNYELFEKLAGVRGEDSRAISRPKGIPEDASYAYRFIVDSWGSDSHSHSYFTLEELMKEDFSSFENFQHTIKRMKTLDPDPSKVRCCFFFDN